MAIRKFPKRGTIGHLVLTTLAKDPEISSDKLGKRIFKKFPDSAWGPSHLAWYRHQVKVGNYVLPKIEVEDVGVKDVAEASQAAAQ